MLRALAAVIQRCLQPDAAQGKTFKVDYLVTYDKIGADGFDKSALNYEWVTR